MSAALDEIRRDLERDSGFDVLDDWDSDTAHSIAADVRHFMATCGASLSDAFCAATLAPGEPWPDASSGNPDPMPTWWPHHDHTQPNGAHP